MRYTNFEIVFSEIPNETTLAINISNCINNCQGCHSSYLKEDVGIELKEPFSELEKYIKDCTCILFLGEGNNQKELINTAALISDKFRKKIALYSGREEVEDIIYKIFDYVKIGPYKEEFGPLNKLSTNQRLYKIEHIQNFNGNNIEYNFIKHDITYKLQK